MQNQFFPEGKTSYVTVGEIPGTDKADEVVMMGGHLDSWTSATGATDNAIGCAIMMEAARILEAVGAKPRRTIRVALWSGEEEGLLGSFAYVENHFGSAENPKPEFSKLDAYWNIDDGARAKSARRVDHGTAGSGALSSRSSSSRLKTGAFTARRRRPRASEGGSDNGAFAVAGMPGIGTRQGSYRIQQHDVAHEPRHLRAHRARRRDEERDNHGSRDVRPRDARPTTAALLEGRHAGRATGARRRRGAAPDAAAPAQRQRTSTRP